MNVPAAFESAEAAAKAACRLEKGVLKVFGTPRGRKAEYDALARVYRALCKKRREECASADALAKSWMAGEGLPGMWEAAEAVANAMLVKSGDACLVAIAAEEEQAGPAKTRQTGPNR